MSEAAARDFLKQICGDRPLQAELDSITTTTELLEKAAVMGYIFSEADLSAVLTQMREAEYAFVSRGGCFRGVWRGPRHLRWDVAVYSELLPSEPSCH